MYFNNINQAIRLFSWSRAKLVDHHNEMLDLLKLHVNGIDLPFRCISPQCSEILLSIIINNFNKEYNDI